MSWAPGVASTRAPNLQRYCGVDTRCSYNAECNAPPTRLRDPTRRTFHLSPFTSHFSPLAYRVAETSIFLASPAPTSTSAEPFSLFASQVTKYLPAGKYKRGI